MNRTPLKNDLQYQTTKNIKERFEQSLKVLKSNPPQSDPILLKAQIESIESVLEDFNWELDEYEKRSMKK